MHTKLNIFIIIGPGNQATNQTSTQILNNSQNIDPPNSKYSISKKIGNQRYSILDKFSSIQMSISNYITIFNFKHLYWKKTTRKKKEKNKLILVLGAAWI